MRIPFLELSVLIPLAGAALTAREHNSYRARKWCLLFAGLTLLCAIGAWFDYSFLSPTSAGGEAGAAARRGGFPGLEVDELSAPLFPMFALLHFLTALATLRTKMRRYSFSMSLVSEAIRLATFGCKSPWGLIALLALGTIPPWIELRARGRSTRVFTLHMLLFVGLLVVGQSIVQSEGDGRLHSWWAILPLLVAVLIRSGMIPVHCWMTDLFENATFGTALLFTVPLPGAYAAVRLIYPIAPDGILQSMGLISLATVVYGAGMALVQREARRFFCYLFLSHAALVFVGLESVNVIGVTGALSVWLSVCFSLGGLGLTLRSLEARFGRLSLADFHGLYEHTPLLAVCFALTGLASVGFPGTLGFVGTEMLVEGAVETYPHVGFALIVAAALNGIAVVRAYFRLFTGTRHSSTVSLTCGIRERIAVVTLTALILGGGLYPQPKVASRFHAAEALLRDRSRRHMSDESETAGRVLRDAPPEGNLTEL